MEPYADLTSAANYADDAALELRVLRDQAKTSPSPLGARGVQSIVGKVVTALDATGQRTALIESLEFHLNMLRDAPAGEAWATGVDLDE